MQGFTCGRFGIALICLCVINLESVFGQTDRSSRTGADLFPESTIAYVEVPKAGDLIERILDHPLRSKIEELEQVKKALNSPQMKQLRIGLAFIETQIGEQWLPALKKLTARGLYLGFDPETQGVAVAFQSSDEELLKKTAGVILGFVKNDGKRELKIDTYRSGKVAEIDDVAVGRFGNWFLISNQSKMARQMADNLLDGNSGLTGNASFKRFKNASPSSDAWAFADLERLRKLNVAKELFSGATDEPGVELLFGGILEVLERADTATASLNLENKGISLAAQMPFDSSKFDDAREFYFGHKGEGTAPAPIEIPNLLGQVVSYRDLGGWWLSKEELYPENVIAQLAQSDSQLSTVFGGMDFGSEVLGAFQPGLRLVAKRQEYDSAITPDIKLPAFALVGKMRDPTVQRRFGVSFQSLIGILNIESAQNDRPQIELITTKQDGITMKGGEYLLDSELDKGLMIYNFSPSIAFQGEYIVISSTADFARELAVATKKLDQSDEASASNTVLSLDADLIKKLLDDNRESLIAQSMIGSGKTRAVATAEVDVILNLLDYLDQGHLDLRFDGKQMKLDVQVGFQGF